MSGLTTSASLAAPTHDGTGQVAIEDGIDTAAGMPAPVAATSVPPLVNAQPAATASASVTGSEPATSRADLEIQRITTEIAQLEAGLKDGSITGNKKPRARDRIASLKNKLTQLQK